MITVHILIIYGETKKPIWAYVTGQHRIPINDGISYCYSNHMMLPEAVSVYYKHFPKLFV